MSSIHFRPYKSFSFSNKTPAPISVMSVGVCYGGYLIYDNCLQRLQVALGFEGGLATTTGSDDGLTIDGIGAVASSEDAWQGFSRKRQRKTTTSQASNP